MQPKQQQQQTNCRLLPTQPEGSTATTWSPMANHILLFSRLITSCFGSTGITGVCWSMWCLGAHPTLCLLFILLEQADSHLPGSPSYLD